MILDMEPTPKETKMYEVVETIMGAHSGRREIKLVSVHTTRREALSAASARRTAVNSFMVSHYVRETPEQRGFTSEQIARHQPMLGDVIA